MRDLLITCSVIALLVIPGLLIAFPGKRSMARGL